MSARGPITDFAILLTPTSSLPAPIAPTETVSTRHSEPAVWRRGWSGKPDKKTKSLMIQNLQLLNLRNGVDPRIQVIFLGHGHANTELSFS